MKSSSPIFSLFLVLFLFGCSEQSVETIIDPDTKPEVPKVETINSDMTIIHHIADTMDRGNHDFFDKDVVIDTKYYEQNEFKRGDIAAFKREDGFYSLYRIIGLPGEKVEIKQGQIYIDGRKLGTFYGRFHHVGMDLDAYKKLFENGDFSSRQDPNGRQRVENHIKYIENSNAKKEVVQDGHVFLIGDDWDRSGTIMKTQEEIEGKVLGYLAGSQLINDPNTKPDVQIVKTITSDMMVIHQMYDGMDRGNQEFFNKDVVVDTKYYQNNQFAMGDIVAIKGDDGEYRVIRVIALPGEKVKIKQGQFYINGKKLNTFYGSFHRVGMNIEQYLEWRKQTNQPHDKGKTGKEVKEEWERDYTYEEINVPDSQVYVMGDDWFRTQYRGPMATEKIAGKVLGYK